MAVRTFVVVGHRVITSPDFNLNDLAGSTGRLDVLLRCVNSAFFLSHDIRRDTELYLIMLGPPNPPKTIRFAGKELRYLNPDERSTAALVRNALRVWRDGGGGGREICASPGVYISCMGLSDVLKSLEGRTVYYMREDGKDLRFLEIEESPVFVLSDHLNFSEEEEKVVLKYAKEIVSVSPLSLHTDHCIILVHNELDRRRV